mmetsp:Transcript_4971/g.10178  ORF Transcript_4971/g.10178 Transcript_4971/m.10178 type:complete len:267 (-) Transcript_4971:895-1695(-)
MLSALSMKEAANTSSEGCAGKGWKSAFAPMVARLPALTPSAFTCWGDSAAAASESPASPACGCCWALLLRGRRRRLRRLSYPTPEKVPSSDATSPLSSSAISASRKSMCGPDTRKSDEPVPLATGTYSRPAASKAAPPEVSTPCRVSAASAAHAPDTTPAPPPLPAASESASAAEVSLPIAQRNTAPACGTATSSPPATRFSRKRSPVAASTASPEGKRAECSLKLVSLATVSVWFSGAILVPLRSNTPKMEARSSSPVAAFATRS